MKTIVIAWLSTRVSGCPNIAKTYASAVVWLNEGTAEDEAKAMHYAAKEAAKKDGSSDHTVFTYDTSCPDPLTRARESIEALVGSC
jgi:hypothetical protein